MSLTLNIGCGEKKDEGMLGLDIRLTTVVDVLADARRLPFRDRSFDRVFSSHTIEHFGHSETHGLLSEWVRVLKISGTMEIRCPDLKVRSLLFFLRSDRLNVKYIYGRQDYEGNYHKSGFSYGLLKRELIDAGLGSVKRVSMAGLGGCH